MTSAPIKVENFTCSCNGVQILKNISFTVRRGDWLSLIGPNGAGKSSMLKSVLGLVRHKAMDRICLYGQQLCRLSPRQIAFYAAYVPQMPPIPPFTVTEFLRLSGYARGRRGLLLDKDVRTALSEVNICEYADKPMKTLSGGILRKVFLAAALAQGTEILALDEPYSFLDPAQASEMNCLLKRLNRHDGKTIVMATHDLNLALDGGGLGLILRNGEQLAFGPIGQFPGLGLLDAAFAHRFHYFRNPYNGKTVILP